MTSKTLEIDSLKKCIRMYTLGLIPILGGGIIYPSVVLATKYKPRFRILAGVITGSLLLNIGCIQIARFHGTNADIIFYGRENDESKLLVDKRLLFPLWKKLLFPLRDAPPFP